MKFKKGDKVVLIDDTDLDIGSALLYDVYTVESYTITDNPSYNIMPILIVEEISGAFDAERFITFDIYRKQKLNKILNR